MSGPERVAACHDMTPRELIAFARSEDAVLDGNWVALSLSLASKLEMAINEARYGRSVDADTDLQTAVRDWQIP